MKGIHWTLSPWASPVAVASGYHRHHHTGWPTERKKGWLLWYLHTESTTSSLNEWLWQLTNEQLTQLIKSYRVTARRVTLQLCAGIPYFFFAVPWTLLFALSPRYDLAKARRICTARCIRSPDLLTCSTIALTRYEKINFKKVKRTHMRLLKNRIIMFFSYTTIL